MSNFKPSKEVGPGIAEMPEINLLNSISEQAYEFGVSAIIRANAVLNAETFEEVYEAVDEDIRSYWIDMDTYKRIEERGDINLLKERLIIHFYSYIIHKNYIEEVRVRGPKGDKLKSFFKAITSDPQDVDFLCDKYGLETTTVKNHRRFDPYPERGITKIKNAKIFRQPVDG